MKRAIPILLLSLLLAGLSTLAFLNNVAVVVAWWRAFAAAGGDTALMPERLGGFLPWLDFAAVDQSTVTTFIPMLGFWAMARGAWQLVFRRRVSEPDCFPFFAGSDQLHVALGLFGTLWGIIVIGYFRLDTVQMANLMQCLHTALYSTLMAVVWVFLFDRPLVRPYFRRLLDASGLAPRETDGDLAQAVGRLVTQLDAASAAFDRRQQEYEAAFEARRQQYAEHFERRLADYEREFEARQREYVEVFQRRIGELERRAETSEAKLQAVAAALKG